MNMISYDILIDGKLEETFVPVNQRFHESYWCLIDWVEHLKGKYKKDITVVRRNKYNI